LAKIYVLGKLFEESRAVVSQLSDELDSISNQIRVDFLAQDAAREKALPLCREVIRYSSNTIRAIHRHETQEAANLLSEARRLLGEVESHLAGCRDLQNTHFLWDAQKEYTEASAVLCLVTGITLPSPGDLDVDNAAYLNGLGEAANELRRYLLDGLRNGDYTQGEKLLSAMDDIYNVLVTMDFPDGITGGLRRTTDILRGVMEKTRSDLTLSVQQKKLENKIDSFSQNIR
jgi:translin